MQTQIRGLSYTTYNRNDIIAAVTSAGITGFTLDDPGFEQTAVDTVVITANRHLTSDEKVALFAAMKAVEYVFTDL